LRDTRWFAEQLAAARVQLELLEERSEVFALLALHIPNLTIDQPHAGVQARKIDQLHVIDPGQRREDTLEAARAHEQVALLDDELTTASIATAIAIDRDSRTHHLKLHAGIVSKACKAAQAPNDPASDSHRRSTRATTRCDLVRSSKALANDTTRAIVGPA
jgi:hypothetical protein